MLRRYENNRIFASAAYNAGPSNVDRWINPELPLDVWIETIPFTETRNYVQNVLMFSAIYGRLLKQNQPLIYRHEFEDFYSPIRIAPANDSPAIDSPAINSPAIDNQPINPQEIDALAPVIRGGIENTNASE
jgi:hypothetical protein